MIALRDAEVTHDRVATLTVVRAAPERTTADALAMGIDTRMASYKTYYSGTTDRITNLQLGVRELDQSGLAEGDQNWSNLHTAYTHGNGIIAAATGRSDEESCQRGLPVSRPHESILRSRSRSCHEHHRGFLFR